MTYNVGFLLRALKDLERLPETDRARIVERTEALRNNLSGDVKKLANFTPEYRLRVGNYRVLFEVEGDKIIVYRVQHRKDVYR